MVERERERESEREREAGWSTLSVPVLRKCFTAQSQINRLSLTDIDRRDPVEQI